MWSNDLQALVKVRVCPDCAVKLNWKKQKEIQKLSKLVSRSAKHQKHKDKERRRGSVERANSRDHSRERAGRVHRDGSASRELSPALGTASPPLRCDAACHVSPDRAAECGRQDHDQDGMAVNIDQHHMRQGADAPDELEALRAQVRREGRGSAGQLDALREQLRRQRSRSRGPSATPDARGGRSRVHGAHERSYADVGVGAEPANDSVRRHDCAEGQAHERLRRAAERQGSQGAAQRGRQGGGKVAHGTKRGFDGLIDDMLL